jgi:hypothetical protein
MTFNKGDRVVCSGVSVFDADVDGATGAVCYGPELTEGVTSYLVRLDSGARRFVAVDQLQPETPEAALITVDQVRAVRALFALNLTDEQIAGIFNIRK